MMTEQRVSPFANGTEYMMWQQYNCQLCKKLRAPMDGKECEIDHALFLASFDDGTISHEIAKRMGRLDHPVNEIFQCHEFEPKER